MYRESESDIVRESKALIIDEHSFILLSWTLRVVQKVGILEVEISLWVSEARHHRGQKSYCGDDNRRSRSLSSIHGGLTFEGGGRESQHTITTAKKKVYQTDPALYMLRRRSWLSGVFKTDIIT